ncbi:Piso0_005557 [Millerozyma farinosa CBS 7064]|uniref:Piso0_005557 protein n=1 Tax=Pichia sorbitophila (strain ATCC MYA-4447 / BCRC 22081 / CBS 7064 / NBRC 10061 / NRRL Y-12695) TaxID=559304 RepID=G8Y2A6_PICSO|nr:Piso0_005557 [Millerozyma farinosa CBS 7064]
MADKDKIERRPENIDVSGALISNLPKEDIIIRVLELEKELQDFQESSKELEQALEEELADLEETKKDLEVKLETKTKQLDESTRREQELRSELLQLNESFNKQSTDYKNEILCLKERLVTTEISNDNMIEIERLLNYKVEMSDQTSNELLERVALLENDLERERSISMQRQLNLTNSENKVTELNGVIAELESRIRSLENAYAGNSVMSLKNMLSTDPKKSSKRDSLINSRRNSHLPHSESLKKLHVLNNRSENMSYKLQDLKDSINTSSERSMEKTSPGLQAMNYNSKSVPATLRKSKENSNSLLGDRRSNARKATSQQLNKHHEYANRPLKNSKGKMPLVPIENEDFNRKSNHYKYDGDINRKDSFGQKSKAKLLKTFRSFRTGL